MADASNPRATASHKRVGSVVRGKYRVEAFLATGTMANVYAATHRNGARVALKIMHPKLAADPALCERFKREGYFANAIGHPGIVKAIDDDITEDGCAFLVMELLEGETLEERRRRKGGTLPLGYVLPVADSLLEILAAAHARDVVHRDLKPDNVFVTKTGDVKVLDFGVARWNDGKKSSDMTGIGMVLGTPAYMPPEQALGRREDVDAQSDLWAVGATLFVVLSGEPVHAGGDAKAKLIATARTAARPLREVAPDVPRSVATVIDRALAFHKSERWPDADAMREALKWARKSLEDRPSQADAMSKPAPEYHPPPVPTRRLARDDEPTVTRAAISSERTMARATSGYEETLARPRSAVEDEILAREARPSAPPIDANEFFMTSAPPITLRDAPGGRAAEAAALEASSSGRSEPIFSLRREKESEASPSTQRLPTGEEAADLATAHPALLREDSGVHANRMPKYDPSAAIPERASLPDDGPASERLERSADKGVEVNLTFTRPMAAMVMPEEYQSPRPAAGMPPPDAPVPAPAPAAAASNATAVIVPDYPFGSDQPAYFSSAPPQETANLSNTGPQQFLSSPPHGSSAPMLASPAMMTTGPMAVPLAAPSHSSLGPDPTGTGPILSASVLPRPSRFWRIGLPLMLLLMAVAAGVVAMRTRAASARARAAAAPPAIAAAAPPSATAAASEGPSAAPPASAVAVTGTVPGSAPPPAPTPSSEPSIAASSTASEVAAATPSPAGSEVKKPKKKRKPRPPPVDGDPGVINPTPFADPPEKEGDPATKLDGT